MDLKKDFSTNKKLEEEGAWVDVGDGGKLKIARAGNKKAIAHLRLVSKPHMAQITYGKLADEVATELAVEVIAEAILLDWSGMTDGGKPLPYSKENAIKMLTDYPDFRDLVSKISDERKTFQKEIEEAVTKN
jgi:hypothetical protein